MKHRAFVLLSGGIDSSTCLAIASSESDAIEAISIDYGQRHHKEMDYAEKQCSYYGIPHKVIRVPSIIPSTMLTDTGVAIPSISYSDIKGVSPTYVPFRNGFMLSIIAAQAQKWINDQNIEWYGDQAVDNFEAKPKASVYFGAHAEDAANWAYPDCTPEFIGAMANAIYIGTYMQVRLHTPLMWLTKAQIIERGERLGVKWRDTWSCYAGEDLHCGTCPTCRARKTAFKDAGVLDPTSYADNTIDAS